MKQKSRSMGFAAKSPLGILAVSVIDLYASGVRREMARINEPDTWKQMYREGWRVVQVEVREI